MVSELRLCPLTSLASPLCNKNIWKALDGYGAANQRLPIIYRHRKNVLEVTSHFSPDFSIRNMELLMFPEFHRLNNEFMNDINLLE